MLATATQLRLLASLVAVTRLRSRHPTRAPAADTSQPNPTRWETSCRSKMPRSLAANYVRPEANASPVAVSSPKTTGKPGKDEGNRRWALNRIHFKTRNPRVNCICGANGLPNKSETAQLDRRGAQGLLYFPPPRSRSRAKKRPATQCADELTAAQATLTRAARSLDDPRTGCRELPPTGSRPLYHYDLAWIAGGTRSLFPASFCISPGLLYTYAAVVDAYKSKGNIPAHWQPHFALAASLSVDPAQDVMVWMLAVNKCLGLAVTAHVQGDMAPSLEQAYRSYSAKYAGVPPFDAFKEDFFARNLPVFEKARLSLVNEG